MNYKNNKVSDLQIAYIGGGSRGWAWTFMTDLCMDDALSGKAQPDHWQSSESAAGYHRQMGLCHQQNHRRGFNRC